MGGKYPQHRSPEMSLGPGAMCHVPRAMTKEPRSQSNGAIAMWKLTIVKGGELAEKLQAEWPLPQPLNRVTLGRDPASHWLIADRTLAISAHHCEIVDSALGPVLRDLSTNGTFVNGATSRLTGEHLLRDGDRLELGPFQMLVSGPPMPPRPAVVSTHLSMGSTHTRSQGVHVTAPQRGGDPAAMLAHGGGRQQPGLTEILLAAPPSVDSGLDMTRIREVPPSLKAISADPPARAVGSVPAPGPASTASPPAPIHKAVPPQAADLAQALARGLGVPVSALEGQELLGLVENLAAAARAAHAALGPLLGEQERR